MTKPIKSLCKMVQAKDFSSGPTSPLSEVSIYLNHSDIKEVNVSGTVEKILQQYPMLTLMVGRYDTYRQPDGIAILTDYVETIDRVNSTIAN